MPPVLTDKRNWFDTDAATSYPGTDGSHMWRTAKNAWILETTTGFAEQPPAAAFEWLIANAQSTAAQNFLPAIWDERAI